MSKASEYVEKFAAANRAACSHLAGGVTLVVTPIGGLKVVHPGGWEIHIAPEDIPGAIRWLRATFLDVDSPVPEGDRPS